MKNSFKVPILFLLLSLLSFVGVKSIIGNNAKMDAEKFIKLKTDTTQAISSVKEIGQVVSQEMYIDTNSFGVCDTCVTSFTNVVQENRQLSDSLFKENMILYEKLETVKLLNDSLDKGILLTRLELIRTKKILLSKR